MSQETFSLYPNLESVSTDFRGLLLDAYGVFWNGNRLGPFTGAREAMEKLVNKGKIIGILSNSTQMASSEIEKIEKYGLIKGQHYHFFITSGEVTKEICDKEEFPFPTPKKKFFVFGDIHPQYSPHQLIFEKTHYQETPYLIDADFIYISIPHINGKDQTDPLIFKDQLSELCKSNIPMVCANPDRFAHEGNPARAVVRQGSIAAMYEELGGKVFYIGKPSEKMYSAAMRLFKHYDIFIPEDVLMVGDTPETDIRGACRYGMPSALVIQTGIMGDRIFKEGLQQAIHSLFPHDIPTFFIKCLANNEC